jgi:hypothetical protein
MPKLHPLAAVLAASVALVAAAPVVAAPVTVNLRIEGATKTHFEGPVTTDVKTVRGELCDGTQDPSNTTPAPTMQGALDDASLTGALTWEGAWDPGYQDFFVTKINDEDTPSDFSQSWALLQNWKYTPGGGCHMQVHQGDELLFAFTDYVKQFLQLTGAPTRAATGESFQVTVNRQDGNGTSVPEPGASVAATTTDATGHATVSFADAGTHTFKATSANTIRSNAATVCVYVPGSGDCGTEKAQPTQTTEPTPQPQPQPAPAVKDTTPPEIKIESLTPGKTYSPGPRLLAGAADDAGGIAQVFLRLRATDGGNLTATSRCRWFSGKRSVFTHRTVPCSKARFFRLGTNPKFSYLLPSRLRKGKYVLDVKVLDRAYNAGRMAVPFQVK